MIIDEQYYKNTFKGTLLQESNLLKILESAEYDIHSLTSNRSVSFASLSPFQQDLIKRAICEQAEHRVRLGDDSGLEVQSLSSEGSSIVFRQGESTRYSRVARDLVMDSGLMYAGFY